MTEVERWSMLELPVDGPVSTVFRHESGESAYAESFQDGGHWLIRFMPSLEGDWAGTLAGTSFTCVPATTPGPAPPIKLAISTAGKQLRNGKPER